MFKGLGYLCSDTAQADGLKEESEFERQSFDASAD